MDINLWLIAHEDFITTVNDFLGKEKQTNFFDPAPGSVFPASYPLVQFIDPLTEKAVVDSPVWYTDTQFKSMGSFYIWHLYLFGVDLGAATVFREEITDWLTSYPSVLRAAGCWDVATGEPVGGVGSPWFVTPPDLINFMPDVPLPPDGTVIGPSPELLQVTLLAGQAPRKFV